MGRGCKPEQSVKKTKQTVAPNSERDWQDVFLPRLGCAHRCPEWSWTFLCVEKSPNFDTEREAARGGTTTGDGGRALIREETGARRTELIGSASSS